MNIVEGKAIFLATPRTASRSCAQALSDAGFPTVNNHHTLAADVLKYKREVEDLPTITILRDPVHMLFSYWWIQRHRLSFEDFARHKFKDITGTKRLFIYWEITDEYFPFVRGVRGLLHHLGLPNKYVPPDIGMEKVGIAPDRTLITDRDREIVRKYFPQDMEIYDGQVLL